MRDNSTISVKQSVITRPDRERTRGELGNAGRDESQSALALGRALDCASQVITQSTIEFRIAGFTRCYTAEIHQS